MTNGGHGTGGHGTAGRRQDSYVITAAGHFLQEEAPDQVWQHIADFAGLTSGTNTDKELDR